MAKTIDVVSLAAAPLLTRGVELNDLLAALVRAVVEQLGCEQGTLYLVDGAAQTVTSIVGDVPAPIHLAVGQGIAGAVAKTGQPIRVVDARADHRFDGRFDDASGFVTRSVMAIPMLDSQSNRAEVIGVLQLLNASKGSFNDDDERAAQALAQQVGAVVERTSLYAEIKKRSPLADAQRPSLAFRYNQIVGESEPMKAVYAVVEKAAPTAATVLITGESGTGKELIARALHHNSPRKSCAFVKVDCTTLPEALMENELFGHEKGAFTGADKTTTGKLEAAAGGTLFIDEIGELPLKLQGKLLRVLQDREFERVGGNKTIAADVRILCATHRDLGQMVQAGTFREDLYYRIRVVPVHMPPLRSRGPGDVLRLIAHFIDKFARRHGRPAVRIDDEATAALLAHRFPGNIRELEHMLESAVVLCTGDVIQRQDLALSPPAQLHTARDDMTLAEVERAHIHRVMALCDDNQSEAARRLGISRNTLARKLNE
jgi:transcriptional regulator with GAF, ATPase, and Fis domain